MARQPADLHAAQRPADVIPAPGRTYTRDTWPPRGRGRGEGLLSPRRVAAKLRAVEVMRLRCEGLPWRAIAARLEFADASGPYRAYKRARDRVIRAERWRELHTHSTPKKGELS